MKCQGFALFVTLASTASADGSNTDLPAFCEVDLVRSAKVSPFITSATAYGPRGGSKPNRCEGEYYLTHTAKFELFSFWYGCTETVAVTARNLAVAWLAPPAEKVHLRVRSTNSPTHYEMDTANPGEIGTFIWPTTVVRQLNNLGAAHLVAVTQLTAKSGGRYLVPVRTHVDGAKPGCAAIYHLAYLPNLSLRGVKATLKDIGGHSAPIVIENPKGYGVADLPYGIEFSSSQVPAGTYFVDIEFTPDDGSEHKYRPVEPVTIWVPPSAPS